MADDWELVGLSPMSSPPGKGRVSFDQAYMAEHPRANITPSLRNADDTSLSIEPDKAAAGDGTADGVGADRLGTSMDVLPSEDREPAVTVVPPAAPQSVAAALSIHSVATSRAAPAAAPQRLDVAAPAAKRPAHITLVLLGTLPSCLCAAAKLHAERYWALA